MNSRVRPSLIPKCSACVHSYIDAGLPQWRPMLQHQMRGAKSSKQPETIPVQLLKDLEFFGRKGSIVPVPAGTMRNKWFPYQVARYLTFEERRAVKRGEVEALRDYAFEIRATKSGEARTAKGAADAAWQKYLGSDSAAAAASRRHVEAETADIEIKAIEPSRAASLLDVLLPDSLDFERKPVPKPQSTTESKSKLPASVQAMLKASMPETPTAIYGSVSTQDIAQYIRDSIAYNDEAAQIQLGESNVKIVDPIEGDDATRIKHLGQYEVEVSFKGADLVVRRRVAVIKPREEGAEGAIDPSMHESTSSADVLEHR